jgi:hypothetical protein
VKRWQAKRRQQRVEGIDGGSSGTWCAVPGKLQTEDHEEAEVGVAADSAQPPALLLTSGRRGTAY